MNFKIKFILLICILDLLSFFLVKNVIFIFVIFWVKFIGNIFLENVS